MKNKLQLPDDWKIWGFRRLRDAHSDQVCAAQHKAPIARLIEPTQWERSIKAVLPLREWKTGLTSPCMYKTCGKTLCLGISFLLILLDGHKYSWLLSLRCPLDTFRSSMSKDDICCQRSILQRRKWTIVVTDETGPCLVKVNRSRSCMVLDSSGTNRTFPH